MLEAQKDDADLSVIFTKEEGDICTRLNFYVQHLQLDIHSWLLKTIKDHGGKVSNEQKSSVPKRGYILIDPGSSRGQELAAKYPSNPNSPRWVVSWTFITACLQAKKVLDATPFAQVKPLFLDPDHHSVLSIHIHPTIQGKAKKALATKIAHHGGIIAKMKRNARVILCPLSHPKLPDLRKRYPDPATKAIEPPSWVTDCIEAGTVSFLNHKIGDNVPFTDGDDNRLAAHLAENCAPHDETSRFNPAILQTATEEGGLDTVAPGSYLWKEQFTAKPKSMDQPIENYPPPKTNQEEQHPTMDLGDLPAYDMPISSNVAAVPNQEKNTTVYEGDSKVHETEHASGLLQPPHEGSVPDAPAEQSPFQPPLLPDPISATISSPNRPVEPEDASPSEAVGEIGLPASSITGEMRNDLDEGLANAVPPISPPAKRRRLSMSRAGTPGPGLERSDEASNVHSVVHLETSLPSVRRKRRNVGEILRVAQPVPSTVMSPEVDEADDLDFNSAPGTQAMLAEHRALMQRRSASAEPLRRPSSEIPPGHLNSSDMLPVIESVERGDPGGSRNITGRIVEISALVKQEPWVIDSVPNGLVALAESDPNTLSSEPHPSGLNPALHHRDRGVEANNVIEESPVYALHHEEVPKSAMDWRLNDHATSQISTMQPSQPPLLGKDSHVLRASKRGSVYATPAPTPRPRGNVSSASTSVGRPRRRRGTPLQVVPVTPKTIPTRSRSPSPPPIFADLDPAIARALRKMCRKFSFTPEEVRQKWDINRGDLLATFLVIRKNREFLDQTDACADN